jgi:hypothetical protein
MMSAKSAALAMAPFLRLPSLKVSDWRILSDESLTISADTPVAKLGVGASFFTMTLENPRRSEILMLKGTGGGVDFGAGSSFVDISGDPQEAADLLSQNVFGRLKGLMGTMRSLRDLPGTYSPVFLFPGRKDSANLFTGGTLIITGNAGGGIEAGVGIIIFFDVSAVGRLELAVAAALGGPLAEAAAFSVTSVTAFAFVAGLDYISDASAGAGGVVYTVHSSLSKSNACFASTG